MPLLLRPGPAETPESRALSHPRRRVALPCLLRTHRRILEQRRLPSLGPRPRPDVAVGRSGTSCCAAAAVAAPGACTERALLTRPTGHFTDNQVVSAAQVGSDRVSWALSNRYLIEGSTDILTAAQEDGDAVQGL
jgi:hypothetical protein